MRRYTLSVLRAWSGTIVDVVYEANDVAEAIAQAKLEFPGWEITPVGIAK